MLLVRPTFARLHQGAAAQSGTLGTHAGGNGGFLGYMLGTIRHLGQ